MSSSAFSLTEVHSPDAFAVTQGEPVLGGLQHGTRHYFCSHCKSWLFTRPEETEAFVNVRATMMADAQAFFPFAEVYTDEGLAWARTGATYSFGTVPTEDEWPGIVAAYQAAQQQDT